MPNKTIQDIKKPDGTPVKGVEMDFEVQREEWNEYVLSDGTTLRTKNMLVKAYLVVDDEGNPKTSPDGEPEVVIRHATMVVSRKAED